jgi:hypothetical protein
VECGEFVAGIDFTERCGPCHKRRTRRAQQIASRVALGAVVLAAAWCFWGLPRTPSTRWLAALAIGGSYALVYLIVRRVAMVALP